MPAIVRLKDYAHECLTRRQGELVRERLVETLKNIDPGEKLTIDFIDVGEMTPSFADECFAKLMQIVGTTAYRQRVSMINANETVRCLINAILAEQVSRTGSRD